MQEYSGMHSFENAEPQKNIEEIISGVLGKVENDLREIHRLATAAAKHGEGESDFGFEGDLTERVQAVITSIEESIAAVIEVGEQTGNTLRGQENLPL